MSRPTYDFKTSDGDIWLPANKGGEQYLTDQINSIEYNYGVAVIRFFDANKQPITPSGGGIGWFAEPLGFEGQLLAASQNSSAAAIDVIGVGDAVYQVPVFFGPINRACVRFLNVTGVSFARAYYWGTNL